MSDQPVFGVAFGPDPGSQFEQGLAELKQLLAQPGSSLDRLPGIVTGVATAFASSEPEIQKLQSKKLASTFQRIRTRLAKPADASGSPSPVLLQALITINQTLRARKTAEPFESLYDWYEYYDLLSKYGQYRSWLDARKEMKVALETAEEKIVLVDFERPGRQKGQALSRAGDVYRALCCYLSATETEKKKEWSEKALSFFSQSRDSLGGEEKASDIAFTWPRMAECYRNLGETEEAIKWWTKVTDLDLLSRTGHERPVWESWQRMGDGHRDLAREAAFQGEGQAAAHHLGEAERCFLLSFRVWEPTLDPCQSRCGNPMNVLGHRALAWHYFENGDYPAAERQAGYVTEWEPEDPKREDHKNLYDLNLYVKALAVLWQSRYHEAIALLRNLLDRDPALQHRRKPLLALLLCYMYEGDQQGQGEVKVEILQTLSPTEREFYEKLTDQQIEALLYKAA